MHYTWETWHCKSVVMLSKLSNQISDKTQGIQVTICSVTGGVPHKGLFDWLTTWWHWHLRLVKALFIIYWISWFGLQYEYQQLTLLTEMHNNCKLHGCIRVGTYILWCHSIAMIWVFYGGVGGGGGGVFKKILVYNVKNPSTLCRIWLCKRSPLLLPQHRIYIAT